MRSYKIKTVNRRSVKSIFGHTALGLALLLLSMASCVKEPLDNDGDPLPPVPDGKVRLELFTDSGEFQQPVSRAGANEDDITASLPWVLVFQGYNDNAFFVEAVQAVRDGTQTLVTLTANNNQCRLLIIANAPSKFNSANIDFDAAGLASKLDGSTTLRDAVNTILTTVPMSSDAFRPYNSTADRLPMSCLHNVAKIDATTQIGTSGGKLSLTRAVAKVTVASTAADFTLSSATVANAKSYGRLHKLAATPPAGDLINYADATAMATENTIAADPIYIYESAAGETSVIVKGEYTNPVTSAKTSGYYRLAFKSKGNAGITDGTIMAVERNKWYKFTITSVSGAGFGSIDEAIAAPPSNNITTVIAVTDLSSHDIVDNGRYYLGVSNSEFVAYSDADLSSVVAVTVATDATTAMSIPATSNTISAAVTGGTGAFTVSPATLTLSGTDVSAQDITITSMDATVTSGTITIKLGNLQKTIKVTRKAMLDFGASVTEFSTATGFSDDFAAGKIEPSGLTYGGAGWLSLSLDGVTPASGSEVTRPDAAGSLYLMATKNVAASGTSARTGGIAYLSRQSDKGRVKLYLAQDNLNTGDIGNDDMINDKDKLFAYVGAFWRWNQTGERVIRIGVPYNDALLGAWTATVIEGGEWIKLAAVVGDLSKGGSEDQDMYTATPADMNDPTNDAKYQVSGNATSVSGNYIDATTPILFRIGLKSQHPDGALAGDGGTATPRYGLILLEYGGTAKKKHKIYVRQGEVADYIGGDQGPTTGTKWAVYNVGNNPVLAPFNNGGFVDYPSQAGYFKQWSTEITMYAPVGTLTIYSETTTSIANICPTGYRIPTSNGTPARNTQGDYWSSDNEMGGLLDTGTSNVWGYYADGFFDRRQIGDSNGRQNSTVSGGNNNVAYIGRLIFNTNTNASIFLPAVGTRNSTPSQAGSNGFYWSSSPSDSSKSYCLYFYSGDAYPIGYPRSDRYSVRCVRQ